MCFDLIRISSEYLFFCSAVESFEDFVIFRALVVSFFWEGRGKGRMKINLLKIKCIICYFETKKRIGIGTIRKAFYNC